MENIVIRKSTDQDTNGIKDIYFNIRKDEFPRINNKEIHIDDFNSSTEGEAIIVAAMNNNIVGFASIWEPDKFIYNLFVKKGFRRLGVVKILLQEVAKLWGTPLILKCVKENSNAVEFYIKNGWECVKEELGQEVPYYLMRYSNDSINNLNINKE